MFFDDDDDDDERFLNPELFHLVRHAISTNLEVTPYGLRSIPTHTEDGIPIRKLYVSNLPPKATRAELFGVFAQYGFIKSCWLRMGEKGNKPSIPPYAFVTFSNPADAHKALQAPHSEKILRGRSLRISPADSWHQPAEDADGRVRWKLRGPRRDNAGTPPSQPDVDAPETSTDSGEASVAETSGLPSRDTPEEKEDEEGEPVYTILDVLNRDCLSHILSYVPLRDLIRSERVSKGWQNMVQEYLNGIRLLKTSWWQHVPVTLTTAVLRRVLRRAGGGLARLHIDHHWSALNDRTAHTVGKFCPKLEELKVVGMNTKNWNPIIYGCKQIKTLSFISCNKLTDGSLVHLLKSDSQIENLTVANNSHVTGLFLTGSNPTHLTSLAFYNCYSLQGTVLSAAIETLPNLKVLKLDVCPVSMWKIVPLILKKLPKLEELSLSEYTSTEMSITPHGNEEFCQSLATLKELKKLDISRNIYITNAVLKQLAQNCPKLESLNVSSCNSRKSFPYPGVSDDGITAVCNGCPELTHLDISYLAALTDAGAAAAAKCPLLRTIIARGNPNLTAASLVTCLAACRHLEEIDVCGCEGVSEEAVCCAVRALERHPRPLRMFLASTGVHQEECPKHKLLAVNTTDDKCNPNLRPDFVDRMIDEGSDDSLDDLYDPDDFDDFLGTDDCVTDDDFDDLGLELDDDYEALYAYGFAGHDILLL